MEIGGSEDRKVDLFLPLICPGCHRSAYDVNVAWLSRSDKLEPEMLRKTDPHAQDPRHGNFADCPYCGGPLGVPTIFPVLGGGFDVKFTFLSPAGKTS